MNANRGFDEVMIVNPSEEGPDNYKGARLMRFHAGGPPGFGYYGEPSDLYGYYAEPPDVHGYPDPPDGYGYYADPYSGYGYYAENPYPSPNYGYYPDPSAGYGYYADPSAGYGYYSQYPDATGYGYYSQYPDAGYGYYGQYPDMGGYGEPPAGIEPVGYSAEEDAMGYYGNEYAPPGYGQEGTYGYYAAEDTQYPMGQHEEIAYWSQPEMVGYGQYDPQQAYPGISYYGEPDMSGYVRQARPAFNAGCPMPTNVAGFDEDPLEGYVKPATVNPNCTQFTPQPGEPIPPPEGFKPLW